MAHIALIHGGKIRETEFAPMRDWVECGHGWDWEQILEAYRRQCPERAELARGAVIVLYDQFCVLGYNVLPVPDAAGLLQHWRAVARVARVQVGVKLRPDPKPNKQAKPARKRAKRIKATSGKDVDAIAGAVEQFKREQGRGPLADPSGDQ